MSGTTLSARDRLIVALDVPSTGDAEALVTQLTGHVGVFKIGLELAMSGGIDFARELAADGHAVFLDMKLLDIGNTVTKAVSNAAASGFQFLTIHAYPQAMRAAAAGVGGSDLKPLGVTVLTSLDKNDLKDAGYHQSPADLVAQRAQQAVASGLSGIVCSPQEVERVRGLVGQNLLLVTPGIRPTDSATGDQKRAATPASAIRSGADYLVVGRPITQSADPGSAAQAIVTEIEQALPQALS